MALSEEGYTQRVIAAHVGCTQASVSGILKKKMVYGNVKDAKIPGRKRKTSQKEDRIVVRKSKTDRFKTASQIKAEMQTDYDCRPQKKPRLTSCHNKKRLDFAKAHQNWTAEQWTQVVFSDESRFLLHRSDGRIFVRRMTGEELKENCVQPTVRHGRGAIMVWGCINARGVGCIS